MRPPSTPSGYDRDASPRSSVGGSPDGYIGYRAGGSDTTGLERYLHRHVPRATNGEDAAGG